MTNRTLISTEGKNKIEKTSRILGLSVLVFSLVTGGTIACKNKAEEIALEEEGTTTTEEGVVEFDGLVKVAVGKYVFIPKARGFDMVVQGVLVSGNTSALVDKEVRGEGQFSQENPSILVVNSIDVKETERDWTNVFTRSEEVVLDDYLDLKARDEFEVLKNISYDKKQGWEGKEKVKIYGRLEKETVIREEEQKDIYNIIVFDEKGKQAGKILVDSFTDFGLYYVMKLRLFDSFWFYINIKDTVDWKSRRRTRELFHADVLFAGLF